MQKLGGTGVPQKDELVAVLSDVAEKVRMMKNIGTQIF